MTQEFKNESMLEQNVRMCSIGRWQIKTLDRPITVSESEKQQMENVATLWSKSFTSDHKNWMTEKFGVPSSVIRFDYIIDDTGIIRVFEIEDRPAGLEVVALNNPKAFDLFINSLTEFARYSGKKLGICVSRGRMFNSDDFFWLGRIEAVTDCTIVLGEAPKHPKDTIWFVRSLRGEAEYYHLSPYSLSTIQYEGDKSYGVEMGLWKELYTQEYEMDPQVGFIPCGTTPTNIAIPWDKPFVVKPDAGCRCENVHMYHPKKPGGGYSTRSKIENAIKNQEVKYLQEYYAPEFPSFLPQDYAMIRRCYLTFDIQTKQYKVIGGVWEARPKCHKIHGASDAICGPIVL